MAAKLDTSFSDTSAASAIVAGAAVATQGMARAAGLQLTPWQVRRLLSTCGVSGQPGIGVMPWLPTIAASLSALPDVFARDDELDEGERPRPAGLSGLSPDIRVADTTTPGLEVDIHNRGPALASNVVATVYAYAPAALLYAGNWTMSQTSAVVTVPPGGTTTVTLSGFDAPHDSALLVLLTSELDAGPALPTGFWTWHGLARSSNNLAVRAVSREAASGTGAFVTSTLVRGPAAAELLDVTQHPEIVLRVRVTTDGANQFTVTAPEPLRARLAINNGETATYPVVADWIELGRGKLEPGFEAALGMSVGFGNNLRVEVSQVCEGVEVGRYTWVRSTPGGGGGNTGRRAPPRGATRGS